MIGDDSKYTGRSSGTENYIIITRNYLLPLMTNKYNMSTGPLTRGATGEFCSGPHYVWGPKGQAKGIQ